MRGASEKENGPTDYFNRITRATNAAFALDIYMQHLDI